MAEKLHNGRDATQIQTRCAQLAEITRVEQVKSLCREPEDLSDLITPLQARTVVRLAESLISQFSPRTPSQKK